MCMLSHFSHVQLFETLWALALQVPLSMEFPKQQYWSGWPCPPQEDLSDPEIESMSLTSPALASRFLTTSTTWEAPMHVSILPQTPLPCRLPHSTEQRSLCYTGIPCCLSALKIAVCTCPSQTPWLFLSILLPCPLQPPSFPPLVAITLLSPWVSFSFVNKLQVTHFFLDPTYKGCPMIFLLLWLTSFSVSISRSIHVAASGITSLFLKAE